jgi:hypothetical protein
VLPRSVSPRPQPERQRQSPFHRHQRWPIEIAYLHLKKTVKGTGRVPRGRSVTLVRQEAWALLIVHNITATLAARTAAAAGLDPDRIPFTAVLSLIRGHVTADACCRHYGKRPASGNNPIALLITDILAQPRHREKRDRTSGRTPFQRQNWHCEPVQYPITIVSSNLPQTDRTPGYGREPMSGAEEERKRAARQAGGAVPVPADPGCRRSGAEHAAARPGGPRDRVQGA